MTQLEPLQGVHTVFFDVYNTLARFYPPREEIQTTACQDFGIVVTPNGIARGYALADEFMAQENAGSNPVRSRNPEETATFFAKYERLILQGAGANADLKLAAQVWQRVRQIPYAMALFDDVLPNLARLRALGLTLGLISNVNRGGRDLTESLGLTGHLDVAVTSGEVGAEKPNPPLFLAALDRAGVAPSEAVHVGDQYTSDVVGARNVGIRPVLLDRYGTAEHHDDVPMVGSMEEVVALLGG